MSEANRDREAAPKGIARRKPQKKHALACFFCVRSGSPNGILLRKIQLKIKNEKLKIIVLDTSILATSIPKYLIRKQRLQNIAQNSIEAVDGFFDFPAFAVAGFDVIGDGAKGEKTKIGHSFELL
jgi:hypothetical protein